MKFPDSSLWNYSCQLFQLAEVADACLMLQNDFEADVNLLLFCCWAGDNRQPLDSNDINNLINTATPWQTTIIKPLRETRQLMKNQIIAMPAHLHHQTLANLHEMELNAEHMEQLNLERLLDFKKRITNNDASPDISARNLLLYVQKLEKTQLNDASGHISKLLTQIYGDEPAQIAMMSAMS